MAATKKKTSAEKKDKKSEKKLIGSFLHKLRAEREAKKVGGTVSQESGTYNVYL